MSGAELPWVFGQDYEHLLLAHWPVPLEKLRARVPEPLEVSVFDGSAWLGHDVYVMDRPSVRGLPELPLNLERPIVTLRTLVSLDGVPGIFLFSFDAPVAFASWFETHFLDLRSHAADVEIKAEGQGVTVRSERRASPSARLAARYRSTGDGIAPPAGSLDHFLIGGDRLFTANAAGAVHAIDVVHGPWLLAPAQVAFDENTLAETAGLPGPGANNVRAMYQRTQQAFVALPRRLR